MSSQPQAQPQPQAGPSRIKGKKGKAGGEGKKGKVFLEDKAGLLSLISNVTTAKGDIVESRLAKLRAKPTPTKPPVDQGWPGAVTGSGSREGPDSKAEPNRDAQSNDPLVSNPARRAPKEKKELKASEKRRREKERVLRETKDALMAKEREKKRRKKNTTATATAGDGLKEGVKQKKRVGFA